METPESRKDGAPRSVRTAQGPREAPPSRQWQAIAAMCAAMLVLPIAGWLIFAPSRPGPAPSRTERAVVTAPTSRAPVRTKAPRADEPERPNVSEEARERGHGVMGEVVNPDDKPVGDASVSCALGDRTFDATTDERGRFRLVDDADGCTATAKRKGFAASEEVVLHSGSGNRLRLGLASRITGTVVDQSGAAVTSFWLGVESFDAPGKTGDAGAAARPAAQEVGDNSGAFQLEDLAPGRYVLVASAPDFPIARSAPVDVNPGTTAEDVKIVLKPGGTVVGKVVDGVSGQPVAGAMVFADAVVTNGMRSSAGVTNTSGEFTFKGGCPEGCALRVIHPLYLAEVVPDVRAAAGGAPTPIKVSLRSISELKK